jgi:dolichol-phosphate hexosyltransferase
MAAVQSMWLQTQLPAEILPRAAVGNRRGVISAQAPAAPRGIEPASPLLGSAANSLPFKVSILIPTYNDGGAIAQTISDVLKIGYPCAVELIVVDDGSTDGTDELLAQIDDARLITCRHETNRGKGAALLSAASLATGSYVLLFDADLDYSAEDIPRILAPVLANRCRVVYGTLLCGYNTVRRSYRCASGSRLLTWLANILFDACITDLRARIKLIPISMLDGLALRETGSGLDAEVTAALLKRGIRPFEVPVRYYGRQLSPGKRLSWRDALACVRILVQVRMRRKAADRREDGQGYDTAIGQRNDLLFPGCVDAV